MSSTSTPAAKVRRRKSRKPLSHSVSVYVVEIVPGPMAGPKSRKAGPRIVYASLDKGEAEHLRDSFSDGFEDYGKAYVHEVNTVITSAASKGGAV